jgi:hypothetical protein
VPRLVNAFTRLPCPLSFTDTPATPYHAIRAAEAFLLVRPSPAARYEGIEFPTTGRAVPYGRGGVEEERDTKCLSRRVP